MVRTSHGWNHQPVTNKLLEARVLGHEAVRAGLDEDIKSLGTEIKLVNIVLVPAAFAVAALLIAGLRRRERTGPVSTNKENTP